MQAPHGHAEQVVLQARGPVSRAAQSTLLAEDSAAD